MMRFRVREFVRSLLDEELLEKSRTIERLRLRIEFLEEDLETYRIGYRTAVDEIRMLKEQLRHSREPKTYAGYIPTPE